MFGEGILRGMSVTLKHFFASYLDDVQVKGLGKLYRPDAPAVKQDLVRTGMFTIQYPEEKLAVPENFRCLPILIKDAQTGEVRCTACGICSKVCPPQCIWIKRMVGPDGKSKPMPENFWVDVSICMSCGFCAEFCPFDAIKMDHNYELATYERHQTLVFDEDRLLADTDYYAKTHPKAWEEEERDRRKRGDAKKKS